MNTPQETRALNRTPAQFFFEVGFGAAYAQGLIQNDMKPPFEYSDALVEHAWEIAGEAHDDPAEFDTYLARANAELTFSNVAHPQGDREVLRLREALELIATGGRNATATQIARDALEEYDAAATFEEVVDAALSPAPDGDSNLQKTQIAPDGDYVLVRSDERAAIIAYLRAEAGTLAASSQVQAVSFYASMIDDERHAKFRSLAARPSTPTPETLLREKLMEFAFPISQDGVEASGWGVDIEDVVAALATPTPDNIGALREALKSIVGLLGTVQQPIPDPAQALKIAKAALSTTSSPDAGEAS